MDKVDAGGRRNGSEPFPFFHPSTYPSCHDYYFLSAFPLCSQHVHTLYTLLPFVSRYM
ncbi:hypothetical protein BGW80DRAFT_1353703, partial [Lactifluus volemus]